MNVYEFWKPNIYLYAPWTSTPSETGPLFTCVSDDIEDAIKQAEEATGLSWKKVEMTLTLHPVEDT